MSRIRHAKVRASSHQAIEAGGKALPYRFCFFTLLCFGGAFVLFGVFVLWLPVT
jgi:hypothetical protein